MRTINKQELETLNDKLTMARANNEKLETFIDWQKSVKSYTQKREEERLNKLMAEGLDDKQAQAEIKKPISPLMVATYMADLLTVCRVESDEGTKPVYFYHPDEGIYFNDREFLKDFISVIEPHHNEKRANDCIYHLTRQAPTRGTENSPDLIIVGNGIYNRKTKQLEPFTSNKIFTSKIQTNYNDKATSPNIKGWQFETWLKELFNNNNDLYNLCLQLINAVIRGESLDNMFWFVGEGGTGKGTLQELLINLIGRKNIASIKITDLDGNNRFTLAQAIGKQAIIGDDVQAGAVIKDTSKLFSISGGDTIAVEKKGKDAYSTYLKTVVIQSTNALPKIRGDYHAIRRRMVILPFTKHFKGKPNRAIKSDYIKRPEVLEYVLKLVIDLKYTEFIKPKQSIDMLDDYQESIDPVLAFTQVLFSDLHSTFIPNDWVWWYFKGFTEHHNFRHEYNSQSLHSIFSNYLPEDWVKLPYPVTLPVGACLPKGFKPKDDQPSYLPIYIPPNKRQQRGYKKNK
ncbi:phage/plasmid primase, P4 family [Streptococcus fryi]